MRLTRPTPAANDTFHIFADWAAMNLHEYQAKTLLQKYGIPVPRGAVASAAAEARQRASELGGNSWAVKAQVHAGDRKAAGGVQIVDSPGAVEAAAGRLLGNRIVTSQTGPEGIEVQAVYVEEAFDLDREIYAAVLVNRARAKVSVIVNPKGGAGVESALSDRNSAIEVDIGQDGVVEGEIARIAEALALTQDQASDIAGILVNARRAFVELDASLIEFNPIAVTAGGAVLVLDVKMTIDDNAMFRHPELEQYRDESEVHPQEREAHRFEINYARMGGNIGVVTSGAGLGLAMIDMVKAAGGEPANFMDVRPMASREQVAEGIRLLLGDDRIRVILAMPVGGGLLHCDTIAEGITTVYRKDRNMVPVVYNAAGTGKEMSEMTLRNQGVPVEFADSMEEAVREAVRIANARAA